MRYIAAVLLVTCVPAAAQTSDGSNPARRSAQGDVSVTIYNDNLALVQDRRALTLPTGRSRQAFPDVSAQIRPATVSLTGPGIEIVEQNFDFDLLSPGALMDKAVGETITLVRVNPANGKETRERALVLAANDGVVLQIGDRVEVLRDDGLPARVIFDRVPDNLRARPTLSVTLEAARGGPQPLTLTYLTPGLGWAADYVVLFDEAAGKIDVQGWITLTNNSGTPYREAKTLLVAGSVGQQNSYNRSRRVEPQMPGTESAGRERLGDFYLYPLAERTTIANAQTKQVSFLEAAGSPAVRAYEYRNPWLGTQREAASVSSVLRFSSSRSGGLGDALPAGTVRVYQRDSRGTPQFIGESAIGHTPMGSTLGLTTGAAFDIKVQPTVDKRERVSATGDRWRTSMRYRVTNASARAVTVDLVQAGLWGDTRTVNESQPSERVSADEARWKVAVPANGEATVTATFDSRF